MEKNHIPIIIVNKGNPYYLQYVINQAKLFNPDNDIILLGDKANSKLKNVKHSYIADYFSIAKDFESVYKHMSSNSYSFEIFCFQRWFSILEYVLKNNINAFLCMDSDFLLYESVDTMYESIKSSDFTICRKITPNCTFFKASSLQTFCDFIRELYLDRKYLKELEGLYKGLVDEGRKGGICDMTAFGLYQKYISNNVVDLSIPRDGVAVDDCLLYSNGYEMSSSPDLMGHHSKKIYWKNNLPHGLYLQTGEFVRFMGIHLQGGAKRKIQDFLLSKGGIYKKPNLFSKICWFIKPQVLQHNIFRTFDFIKRTIKFKLQKNKC